MKWLVAATLGPAYVVLVPFQTFQSLYEMRKRAGHKLSTDPRFSRLSDHEECEAHYESHLRYFPFARGIPWDTAPAKGAPAPELNLPEWADEQKVSNLFDFFAALMVRFARLI